MDYKTDFKQSSLTPRPIIFKLVWTIIIILFCYALFNTFNISIFINSLIIFILCVLWVNIFFVNKNPNKSFIILLFLIVSVIIIIKQFYDINPFYAKLQFLFISWLFVALYFNYYIIKNN